MSVRRIVIALAIVFSLIFGAHYYIWLRLVHDLKLPLPYADVATVVLIVLGLSQPVSMFAVRATPRLGRLLAWPAFLWMGTLFLLLVSLAAADLVKALLLMVGFDDSTYVVAIESVAALVAASLSVAAVVGARALKVVHVDVNLPTLAPALEGFVIVQLTDIHVGPTIGWRFMVDLIARVNALNPDVVCITGDLADGRVEDLRDAIEPLRQIKSKYGTYFVTGNHEYYHNVDEWLAALNGLGVRILRNEHVLIADNLFLAGIDDRQGRLRQGHGPDLAKALNGIPPQAVTVLLAHQPKLWPILAKSGVSLVLSGHTHGGQIWPFHYLVRLDQPVVKGLVRNGKAQLYVSTGTGYWGPPMRLGSTAEITRLCLRVRS